MMDECECTHNDSARSSRCKTLHFLHIFRQLSLDSLRSDSFVCQIYSKSRPQNWYTKVSEKSFRLVLISIVQAVLIVGCRTDG